jgi:hypothetical protein
VDRVLCMAYYSAHGLLLTQFRSYFSRFNSSLSKASLVQLCSPRGREKSHAVSAELVFPSRLSHGDTSRSRSRIWPPVRFLEFVQRLW